MTGKGENKVSRKEILKKLNEIGEKVSEDIELKKKSEDSQKKYGTLTSDDLQKIFTI